MTIEFNGVREDLAEPVTIAAFFRFKGICNPNLILELNGEILAPAVDLECIPFNDGDRLNAFSLVGGG